MQNSDYETFPVAFADGKLIRLHKSEFLKPLGWRSLNQWMAFNASEKRFAEVVPF